jgi:DNA-binding transcriptional LysR family regulator
MTNIDWEDLRIFLTAARAASFSAAADNGPENQSTISRRMLNLEVQLGVTLFNRTSRGISLTSAGSSILNLVEDIAREVRAIEARASQEMDLSGVIRLWVSEGVGGYWLPPRMKDFHRRYPGITVDVQCTSDPAPLDGSEADIALSWHRPELPDAVVLSEGTMVLRPAASNDYLQEHGTPRKLQDLLGHRLCSNKAFPKDGDWKVWADLIQKSVNVSFLTNSSLALGQATLNGLGISLQPIGLQIQQPMLRFLDIDGYSTALRFWLSCHRRSKDIPRIRAFINYIKSELFSRNEAGQAFAVE